MQLFKSLEGRYVANVVGTCLIGAAVCASTAVQHRPASVLFYAALYILSFITLVTIVTRIYPALRYAASDTGV